MSRPCLLIDCNFLCYRAFFSTGQLSHMGDPTGVVYGFFRDIQSLQDRFGTDRPVFCFDHGKSLREIEYPGYKSTRRKRTLTDEQETALDGMRQQVSKLKTNYLPSLGYRNVFFQKGYEADDVIASVALGLGDEESAIIVSADKDLYQLLRKNVIVYNPNTQKVFDRKTFINEFGIKPGQWSTVKAIAGCSSDDIAGIEGVGEKTAIQFLRGELKPTSTKFIKIGQGRELILKNKRFVKLPFEGCKSFELEDDDLDGDAWAELAGTLGFKSMMDSPARGALVRQRGFGLRV